MLCIGVAYKPGVDDLRESPALDVMDGLAAKGAVVAYHDPYVARVAIGGRALRSVEPTRVARRRRRVVMLTAHAQLDVHAIVAARHSCSTRAASRSGSTSRTSSGSELPARVGRMRAREAAGLFEIFTESM